MALLCFLLSENSSHPPGSNHYQNTDKPKVTSQPTTERRDLRHGIPTWEPKDMPCHGLCLARVHMSEHDFLLYLFIFLFRELSPFSFLVDLPQVIPSVLWLSYSVSLYLSVMSCPWESYRRVFDMHPHTCVCARIWAVQSQRSFWFQRVHTLPLMCMHTLIASVYLWL